MSTLDRRSALAITAGMAAAATAGSAFAQHEGHGGKKPAGKAETAALVGERRPWKKHAKLISALKDCTADSSACLEHCLNELALGNDELFACSQKVRDTHAICTAMLSLANADSAFFARQAEVCRATCEDCRAECLKHAEHHEICKACADSCKRVIDALAA